MLQALLLPPLWLSIAPKFKKNNDNALLTFWLPMQCQGHPPKCQEHPCQEHPAKCQEHPCQGHLVAAAECPEHRAPVHPEHLAALHRPLIVGPCRGGHRVERREERQ